MFYLSVSTYVYVVSYVRTHLRQDTPALRQVRPGEGTERKKVDINKSRGKKESKNNGVEKYNLPPNTHTQSMTYMRGRRKERLVRRIKMVIK